jgi:hypothetical protein
MPVPNERGPMIVDHHVAERFVRENWPVLAASAWRFHLSYCRGALIVEWSAVKRWAADRAFPFRPRYATNTENQDFNAVIAGYDPRTAVVLAFSDGRLDDRKAEPVARRSQPVVLRPGTALAAMTIVAEPAPPDAHRTRGH